MTAPDAEQAPQPTVLDALRASPVGPLLDQPLPQLPTIGPPPPLPTLPPLPELPPLPSIDQLLEPIQDLMSGFGSGVFGAHDPTQILDQSSQLVDMAMQLSMSGLKTLDQIWQGQAAQQAQQQGQGMQNDGTEAVQRGTDIATVARDAAATVQRGNAELCAVAESFVAQAVAAAPIALTPPGQAALIGSAADHLGRALVVVSKTRAELEGHTAAMGTLAGPVGTTAVPSSTGPSPFAIAAQVVESVGKPLLSTVTDGVRDLVEQSQTFASSADTGGLDLDRQASSTHAASTSTGHAGASGGGVVGGLGGFAGGAIGAAGGAAAAARSLLSPTAGGMTAGGATGASTAAGAAAASASGAAAATGGMMSPLGGARAGNGEDTVRNSPSYLNELTDSSGVVGDLPQVVSPVLGVDYESDFG
ncbi:MAG: hypothetical protein ICV72_03895 [Aldersonia sp.]|nr:hypothetical protein [Aldersonia sp.]